MDYLKTTYGGAASNPLIDECYYCYLIHDTEFDMFYSGAKTRRNTREHGLLETYFTSSSVTDFRARMVSNPEKFHYLIEYFKDKESAFMAEREYHNRYNVGKNVKFYNACNAGGSICGSGSVLCRSTDNTMYRVSVSEYRNNKDKHKHISSGMMNVYQLDGSLKKIQVDDYNKEIHTTELKGKTHVFDKIENKNKRITVTEFKDNPQRYVGVTKGMVTAQNIHTGEMVKISKEEFDNNTDLYQNVMRGKVKVTHRITGETQIVSVKDYDNAIFKVPNTGTVVCYSIDDERKVRIPTDKYNLDSSKYLNSSVTRIYIYDGTFFTNKAHLAKYLKVSRSVTQEELVECGVEIHVLPISKDLLKGLKRK